MNGWWTCRVDLGASMACKCLTSDAMGVGDARYLGWPGRSVQVVFSWAR